MLLPVWGLPFVLPLFNGFTEVVGVHWGVSFFVLLLFGLHWGFYEGFTGGWGYTGGFSFSSCFTVVKQRLYGRLGDTCFPLLYVDAQRPHFRPNKGFAHNLA